MRTLLIILSRIVASFVAAATGLLIADASELLSLTTLEHAGAAGLVAVIGVIHGIATRYLAGEPIVPPRPDPADGDIVGFEPPRNPQPDNQQPRRLA